MFPHIFVYVLVAIVVCFSGIDAKVFPIICGQNETPNICGEGICPPTCCTPNVQKCHFQGIGPVCTWPTTGGCRCVNGTVRNENNNCVPLSECPPGICSSK
ncbi:cysteine-rich venom protein 1 isoform X1 [Apis mellifera carnica]|nr:cysteine-rich venom protein 1 isoform X1 [Apis mellifera carnica]